MHVLQALKGIAEKAKRDKEAKFVNLYRLLNKESLMMAWQALNKKAAAGIDKVTAADYAENLDANLDDLVLRLKEKRYRATPIRRQYIPKANGKMRPLGIPVLEDRLVQRATVFILEAIYEEDFLPVSYGYRPKRSGRDCVKAIRDEIQFGNHLFLVEADIKGFFDHLDHDWLMKMLEVRINDRTLLRLIKKWLIVGILEPDGMMINPLTGTPQGGIISPILANIYLHYVLDTWVEHSFKGKCCGHLKYVRYADDFVVAFETKVDAQKFYEALPTRLGKFNLTVAEDKTRIIPIGRSPKANARPFDFLGFQLAWSKDRQGRPYMRRTTSKKKFQKTIEGFTTFIKESRSTKLPQLMAQLNRKLQGHYSYFGVIGNMERLQAVAYNVTRLLFKWLNRRSQKRSYTWPRFLKLMKRYGLVRPRIYEGDYRQYKLRFF